MNQLTLDSNMNSEAVVSLAELEKVLADRGIETKDSNVAATLEKIRDRVDAGELVLTRTVLEKAVTTIDRFKTGEEELSEADLESVAGGAGPAIWVGLLVLSSIVGDCIREPGEVVDAFNEGRALAKKY